MSSPTLTLVPAGDPFEEIAAAAHASIRAAFIADYLAGNVIDRARIRYEVELYDAMNPGEPPLIDEIDGLHTPAAA
jgi:hypothetical protein